MYRSFLGPNVNIWIWKHLDSCCFLSHSEQGRKQVHLGLCPSSRKLALTDAAVTGSFLWYFHCTCGSVQGDTAKHDGWSYFGICGSVHQAGSSARPKFCWTPPVLLKHKKLLALPLQLLQILPLPVLLFIIYFPKTNPTQTWWCYSVISCAQSS